MLDDLLQIVSAPMRGKDSLHQFEPRIGVAVHIAGDGHTAEQVIGMAAQAAHAARAEGNVVVWFDAAVTTRLADRLRLAGRIHAAIDNEFQLYFQPIRHAGDGSPAALEALLRWPQADGSFIPPNEFIQLCEDTGLILALGRWVIRAAAKAQRRLVEAGGVSCRSRSTCRRFSSSTATWWPNSPVPSRISAWPVARCTWS